jgi:replication factor A1
MRTWSNAKGDGKLFSVDLLDAAGGEIKATAFNGDADRLFPLFQIGKVYCVGKFTLKMANPRYSRLNNDYEISIQSDSVVEEVDDDAEIQQQVFAFRTIKQVETTKPEVSIDIIGIVTGVGPISSITTKKGNDLNKRVISLFDDSGCASRWCECSCDVLICVLFRVAP